MTKIQFYNNWRKNNEFVLISFDVKFYNEDNLFVFTCGIAGVGIVIAL